MFANSLPGQASASAPPEQQQPRTSFDDVLQFKRMSPAAVLPTRATPGSAGYDLAAAEACVVPAHGKALVSTGWAVGLPVGVYGRVAPRSGLAWKHHLDVGAGVCDCDYRGLLSVVIFNHSMVDYQIQPGDRIAQLILEKHKVCEVQEVEQLAPTQRGAGAFGSTGK